MFELAYRRGDLVLWRYLGHLVYQQVADSNGNPAWPSSGQAKNFVLETLGKERLCLNFYGVPRCRTPSGWWRLTRSKADVALINAGVVFVRCRESDLNDLKWSNGARDCDGSLDEKLALVNGVQVCDCPRALAEVLAESCEHFETAQGSINHPVWPEAPEGWLSLPQDVRPLRDTDFAHLRTLFSAWDLSPWSHAALHCFLLGHFHADALRYARPILWLDSGTRECGKSVASQAVTALVDGRESALTLPSDRKSAEETLVSHLVRGGRCANVANLDGRHHFKSELLSNLSTDGADARAKYARETSRIYGNVLMASSVLGRVTVHEDLLSRVWRVELPRTGKLRVEPLDYARDHREELHREVLTAHARALPHDVPTVTRFGRFEAAAAAAYAVVFGLTHEEVQRRLETARQRGQVLQHGVMTDLVAKRPELFDEPLAPTHDDSPAKRKLERYDGAGALGLVLRGGVWEPEACATEK